MIVKQYVKDFENMGLGMFVHFGLYSLIGHGEWVKFLERIPDGTYDKLTERFNPKKTWALELAETAKEAGCGYITITSRHHDGFSMWATKASPYNLVDATPYGKDVIGMLAEACREQRKTRSGTVGSSFRGRS